MSQTDKQWQELESLFRGEARDHLAAMNRLLLQLETEQNLPADQYQNIIREIFRAAHSLKGAARTVNRTDIEKVAHALESAFDSLRNQTLVLTPEVADALYDGMDSIDSLLEGKTEGLLLDQIMVNLQSLVAPTAAEPPVEKPATPRSSPSSAPARAQAMMVPIKSQPPTVEIPSDDFRMLDETIRVTVSKLDNLIVEVGNLLVARINIDRRVQEIKTLRSQHHLWQKQWRTVHNDYIRLIRTIEQRPEQMEAWQPMLGFLQDTQRYMKNVARDLLRLEQAVSEDCLTLGLAADAVQIGLRDMRLLPFETIVGGLQRMVRDVARDLGKEVIFQTVGTHIALDKHVLENIKDPLTHLLRNAIDHGIETPEERHALGKPVQGLILLALAQRGNAINIMVSDDGRGIDVNRVQRKAIQIGLISPTETIGLSKTETYELLLYPGMSTSERVSEISGRGIGLDVVRENVEALQGQIHIESQIGYGSTFEIVLPVSLSTMHCMLVALGKEVYAVPSSAVVRVSFFDTTRSFSVKGQSMIMLDERPMPVVSLREVLERPAGERAAPAKQLVLVIGAGERRQAFLVDDVIAEQEIVVRNLNPEMARVRNISGATVMASGEVVLILNVNDLVKSAQTQRRLYHPEVASGTPIETKRVTRILVVDDSITTRTLQRNILEAAGFEVVIATHGKEALEKLENMAVDLMITDVEMPLMNGFELTAQVRRAPALAHLPIILVTSLDSQENREKGFKAGADAYITKGVFDQNELLHTIKNLL